MPLVRGPRSQLYTDSSHPRPAHFTEVEKLREALLRSQQEVLKMREQMEFLAFLVKRAWMGDRSAMSDVAAIIGVNGKSLEENLTAFTESMTSEGEDWTHMVEHILREERSRDAAERSRDEQVQSTAHFLERSAALEQQLDNHTPVFPSYLNKARGNFRQGRRASSAKPIRRVVVTSRSSTAGESGRMTDHRGSTPAVPASSPRGPSPRPVSAPPPRRSPDHKGKVSVHGSEVLVEHGPSRYTSARCPCDHQNPSSIATGPECTCPVLRGPSARPWKGIPRLGVPTSSALWSDDGSRRVAAQVLQEKDRLFVALLCANGK